MSKKTRYQARKYTPERAPMTSVSAPSNGNRPAASEFTPDYSYVTRDLKRIGILAGSLFGILIVLSFFL